MTWFALIRTIHILSASMWLGEVVVINFILIPVMAKYQNEIRKRVLTTVFPLIFKMASILSLISTITGITLVFLFTKGNISLLSQSKWGISILIGGALGIILTVFHFFIEHRLAKKLGFDESMSDDAMAEFHVKLNIVPRIGLLVLVIIFLMMMNASRNIF